MNAFTEFRLKQLASIKSLINSIKETSPESLDTNNGIKELCSMVNYEEMYIENVQDYINSNTIIPERVRSEKHKNAFRLNDVAIPLPKISSNLAFPIKQLLTEDFDFDVYLSEYNINLQRSFVWTDLQKTELIMSLIKDISIGKFSLVCKRDEDRNITYKVVDGAHRLKTIIEFYTNKFPITFNGNQYFYSELSEEVYQHLNRVYIQADLMYEYSDKPIKDKYLVNWFKRVNYFGSPHQTEHINEIELKMKSNYNVLCNEYAQEAKYDTKPVEKKIDTTLETFNKFKHNVAKDIFDDFVYVDNTTYFQSVNNVNFRLEFVGEKVKKSFVGIYQEDVKNIETFLIPVNDLTEEYLVKIITKENKTVKYSVKIKFKVVQPTLAIVIDKITILNK